MLIATDTAAAQNSQLRPAAQQALRNMATVRSVTLATAQYTQYAGAVGVENVVMSYTFDPGAFAAGTQVRIHLYGDMDGVVGGFSPTLWYNQPNNLTLISIAFGTSGNPDTWIIDADFTMSAANSTFGNTFGVKNSPTTSVNPNVLALRGLIDLRTGTPIAAPTERMNTLSSLAPVPTVVVNQPLQLFLSIMSDINFTVHGGYMEAM